MARRDPRGSEAKKAGRWRVAAYSTYDGDTRWGWGSDFQEVDQLLEPTQELLRPHEVGSRAWAEAWWLGLLKACRGKIRIVKPRKCLLLDWEDELAIYRVECVDA